MAGAKRKSRGDTPDEVYSNKSRSKPSAEAKVDPTYGQRSAIPGLDDDALQYGDDTDLDYVEEMDALAYLRAVRQEATSIPNLLVAPRTPPASNTRDIYEDGVGDFRGYYVDGAYVAQQVGSEAAEEEEEDPQLAYFDSILTRYEALRAQLQEAPPRCAIDRLGKDYPTYVKPLNRDLSRWWNFKMRTVPPKPAQIASFDKGSVLRLLRLLTQGTLLKRGLGLEDLNISRWTWSLLARLPERGELSSEEIGVVRELGKKAVLLGMELRDQEEWVEGIREVERGFEEEGGEEGENDQVLDEEISVDVDEEVELVDNGNEDLTPLELQIDDERPTRLTMQEEANLTAESMALTMQEEANLTTESLENPDRLTEIKARVLAQLNHAEDTTRINIEPEPSIEPMIGPVQPEKSTRAADRDVFDAKLNSKATVDMIISVAGEVYGQRDLLEFRGQWGIVV